MQRKEPKNWKRLSLEMILQATPETLEGVIEQIFIEESLMICVSVEGRKPQCFKCREKGHVRSDWETIKRTGKPSQKVQQNIPPNKEVTKQQTKRNESHERQEQKELPRKLKKKRNKEMEYEVVKCHKRKMYKKHHSLLTHIKKKLPRSPNSKILLLTPTQSTK